MMERKEKLNSIENTIFWGIFNVLPIGLLFGYSSIFFLDSGNNSSSSSNPFNSTFSLIMLGVVAVSSSLIISLAQYSFFGFLPDFRNMIVYSRDWLNTGMKSTRVAFLISILLIFFLVLWIGMAGVWFVETTIGLYIFFVITIYFTHECLLSRHQETLLFQHNYHRCAQWILVNDLGVAVVAVSSFYWISQWQNDYWTALKIPLGLLFVYKLINGQVLFRILEEYSVSEPEDLSQINRIRQEAVRIMSFESKLKVNQDNLSTKNRSAVTDRLAYLEDGDHGRVDMSKRDFRGQKIKAINFSNANLRDANFEEVVFESVVKVNWLSFWLPYFFNNSSGLEKRFTDFSGADLTGANLKSAKLIGVSFHNTIMERAQLSHADLEKVYLVNAKLMNASLAHVNLTSAVLWNANLEGADLTGVNFDDANLEGANLKNAILRGADLQTARHLQDADLNGADLTDALLPENFCLRT
jgi:uncharacterized protein YjbI with pentapeptide repeats